MTGITLPTDTQQSRLAPRPAAPQEDVLDTLREYEHLARITCPTYTSVTEFTADGVTWLPIWIGKEPPAGARSTVTRDGVTVTKNRAWHEALPSDESNQEEWMANPATRIRAFVERAALRDAFADVINRRESPMPDVPQSTPRQERKTTPTLSHPWDEAPSADWTPAKDAGEPAPEAPQPEPPRRPAPQDHLPGNRDQRRAKKRGRR